ncbi:MAG: 2-C-methyl-D-erythritol 2,4-cyclodiphosphate synthase [Leptospiraceae bacterium]|nr:2-C-methyl-D-erythritol 2,4-cyclodiphosphate synthase [Leptospiraceae bacterium]
MYRIGNGIDFHKLEINPDRPLLLGGFEIPGELALVGHSDADIVFHAIADAILGAMGKGDIGEYFPDTDPQYKNMNSALIIENTLDLMKNSGFEIENIDSTLIGERPKVSPYRKEIQKSISKALNLPEDKVSLKATTTEKMGALGRKEGVAVFSTVLLRKI